MYKYVYIQCTICVVIKCCHQVLSSSVVIMCCHQVHVKHANVNSVTSFLARDSVLNQ